MTFFSCKEKPFSKKNITYYVKLQNAYITEAAAIGKYSVIGYEMASTTNFDYTEPTVSWSTMGTIAIPAAEASTAQLWKAKAKVALNDCTVNSEWALVAKGVANSSGVDYEGGIGLGAAATIGTYSDKCIPLTASFKTIADNN